jgi:hypothetical protein
MHVTGGKMSKPNYHYGAVCAEADDDGFYPVTYWAEDGPEERDCESCEKTFFVEEHVARTWKTAKTKEGLDGEEED